ncbi:MAG TPA: FAD-dependent oxidoreductase [Actinoplanes sp.]|nr:FAD-dependent oxidoreductase [Actinoplanes sp.]
MTDVIVIGGGIIGLTAAVRLRQAGAAVRVWSPVGPAETVSAVAAAIWYPTRTEFDPRVRAWGRTTYDEFTRQAGTAPGVLLRRTRNLEREWHDEMPWWAPAGAEIVPGPEPYRREVRFTAPLVEMAAYLPWLAAQVTVERRAAGRLADALAEAPVVVNAAGLAAGRLCGDDAVYPARGQIVLVRNPGLDTSVRAEGDPSAYVHPRSADVVLGGTFEVGERSLEPDPATRDAIVARCVALVPELAGAEMLGEKVGLRPCRRGGPRVERDGAVVHAYGHCGAGMTLCWGTADEVTRLVTDAGR